MSPRLGPLLLLAGLTCLSARGGDPLPGGALARIGTTRLRHPGGAIIVAFSPDGKTLASGGNDELIGLWNPSTGAELRRFKGHDDGVNALAFAPDGKTL